MRNFHMLDLKTVSGLKPRNELNYLINPNILLFHLLVLLAGQVESNMVAIRKNTSKFLTSITYYFSMRR